MNAVPAITSLSPWFGSNRTLVPHVGELLRGCRWVGVPFAGSMTELIYIDAPTLVVSDLHRHVINLARVASDSVLNRMLRTLLRTTVYHPYTLAHHQKRAKEWSEYWERSGQDHGVVEAAHSYFVASWMGRSGKAGTDNEYTGKLPIRWTATGGDSCTRFRSAASSLKAWINVLRRANFVVQDVFEFLGNVKDCRGHGLYCDPPFPEVGNYTHKFTEDQHRRLADRLGRFCDTRVVCRFYDHPLIRELYPESLWAWNHFEGRKQSNASAHEVLLVRNGATRP